MRIAEQACLTSTFDLRNPGGCRYRCRARNPRLFLGITSAAVAFSVVPDHPAAGDPGDDGCPVARRSARTSAPLLRQRCRAQIAGFLNGRGCVPTISSVRPFDPPEGRIVIARSLLLTIAAGAALLVTAACATSTSP